MRTHAAAGSSSGRPCCSSDQGSTILEILVTVMLLSVLGFALWAGAGGGARLVRQTLRRTLEAARTAELDLHLRRAALRVRAPYWSAGSEVEVGPGWLRATWVDGEPDQAVLLERRGHLLLLRLRSDPPVVLGPFPAPNIECYQDAEGHPAGFKVSLGSENDPRPPLVILAPFGGSPVPRRRSS